MRAIKKGEISVKMVYTVTFIGLFLIFAVYGLFTVYDVRRTKKHMMKVFSRIMFMNRDSEEYVYLIRI